MKNKRRQMDPQPDRYSSSDERTDSTQAESKCLHIAKSVDMAKLRKAIKTNGIETEKCSECTKMNGKQKGNNVDADEAFEYDKTLWLCLKCGSQLCGRSKNKHAIQHYETPHSDSHAIALNLTTQEVWCYDCDNEIRTTHIKKLHDCIEFVKKEIENRKEQNKSPTIEDNIDINAIVDIAKSLKSTITTQQPSGIENNSAVIVDELAKLPRVRGLTNLGNTCFFNAVLQCLAQTPYLLTILQQSANEGEEFELSGGNVKLKDNEEIVLPPIKHKLKSWNNLTQAFAETLQELQVTGGVYKPKQLFELLLKCRPQFSGGDQHDSHELLRHLLESVRTDDLRRYQTGILSVLDFKHSTDEYLLRQKCKFYGHQANERILIPDQVFRGFLVSTLICLDCDHLSPRKEAFLDISLPVNVERVQPPIRQNVSPERTQNKSRHQLKKEKEKEKKQARLHIRNQKKTAKLLAAGDAVSPTGLEQDGEAESFSSSGEQSDADVEDNVIEDKPKSKSLLLDSNGNKQSLKSPSSPEKHDDIPENSNKDMNEENDTTSQTECNNIYVELTISENGRSNLIKSDESPAKEFAEMHLNDERPTKKNMRIRTHSYTDWSTTIGPRYICEDNECSIQSCLNNFTAMELMSGNNKVGCDSCTSLFNLQNGKTVNTNASKQFLISSPPAVLILHLKRFQVGPKYMFRKLTKHVTFPFILDIAPFCASNVKKLPNVNMTQKKLVYSLYGVVEHLGGMHGGHYVAYVKVRPPITAEDARWKFIPQGSKVELNQTDEQKAQLEADLAKVRAREMRAFNDDSDDSVSSSISSEKIEGAVGGCDEPDITPPPGKWYHVSDSFVTPANEERVLSAQAYLLFYERIY